MLCVAVIWLSCANINNSWYIYTHLRMGTDLSFCYSRAGYVSSCCIWQ